MSQADGPDRPRIDVGSAFVWAIGSFRHNGIVLVATAAVVVVLMVPQQIAARPVQDLAECVNVAAAADRALCVSDLASELLLPVLVAALFSVISLVAQYGTQRAALIVADGRHPTVPDAFSPRRLGAYALFVIGATVVAAVGLVLCIVPGVIALLFLQFGPFAILDRGCGAWEAARISVRAVASHPGPAVAMGLVNAVCFLLGGLLYGIVGLVTLPFACLFTVHLYRQFTGGTVAAAGR